MAKVISALEGGMAPVLMDTISTFWSRPRSMAAVGQEGMDGRGSPGSWSLNRKISHVESVLQLIAIPSAAGEFDGKWALSSIESVS